jgi:hypothetical protein
VNITGTPQVGQTLSVNTNNLGGSGTISYQWRAGTNNVGTASTLTLTSAHVGTNITVVVTRANNSGSVTSPAVGPVTAAGGGGDGNVSWIVQANPGSVTPSLQITFIGGTPPANLAATHINIANGTGSATRGTLSSGTSPRTLTLSNVIAGTVTVSINLAGIASGNQTVTLQGPSAPATTGPRVTIQGMSAHNGRLAQVGVRPTAGGTTVLSTIVRITSGSVVVGFPEGSLGAIGTNFDVDLTIFTETGLFHQGLIGPRAFSINPTGNWTIQFSSFN